MEASRETSREIARSYPTHFKTEAILKDYLEIMSLPHQTQEHAHWYSFHHELNLPNHIKASLIDKDTREHKSEQDKHHHGKREKMRAVGLTSTYLTGQAGKVYSKHMGIKWKPIMEEEKPSGRNSAEIKPAEISKDLDKEKEAKMKAIHSEIDSNQNIMRFLQKNMTIAVEKIAKVILNQKKQHTTDYTRLSYTTLVEMYKVCVGYEDKKGKRESKISDFTSVFMGLNDQEREKVLPVILASLNPNQKQAENAWQTLQNLPTYNFFNETQKTQVRQQLWDKANNHRYPLDLNLLDFAEVTPKEILDCYFRDSHALYGLWSINGKPVSHEDEMKRYFQPATTHLVKLFKNIDVSDEERDIVFQDFLDGKKSVLRDPLLLGSMHFIKKVTDEFFVNTYFTRYFARQSEEGSLKLEIFREEGSDKYHVKIHLHQLIIDVVKEQDVEIGKLYFDIDIVVPMKKTIREEGDRKHKKREREKEARNLNVVHASVQPHIAPKTGINDKTDARLRKSLQPLDEQPEDHTAKHVTG